MDEQAGHCVGGVAAGIIPLNFDTPMAQHPAALDK